MNVSKIRLAFKMLRPRPSLILALMACSLFQMLPTYCNVLFTSRLIQCIVSSQYDDLTKTMLMMIGTYVLLRLLKSIAESIFNKEREVFEAANDLKIVDKNCGIDYAHLEQNHTQKDLQEARDGLMYSGGVSVLLEDMMKMASSLLTVLISTSTLLLIPNTSKLSYVLLMVLMLIFMTNFYFLKKSSMLQYEFQKKQFRINQEFNYYTSLPENRAIGKDLRIYQLGDMIEEKIGAFFKQSEKATGNYASNNAKVLGCNDALNSLMIGGVYLLVFYFVKMGMMGLGYVARYVGLIQQIQQAFMQWVLSYVNIVQKMKYISFYLDYLAYDNTKISGVPIDFNKDHVFEFKNVSFKYPQGEDYVLKDIDMVLPCDKRTALVGLNGSGKTTVVKLLCRFYQPTKGHILLDGVPIEKYRLSDYYDFLSCVFQDFHLLALSIQENIGADEKRVNKALKEAGVLDRIKQLPKGIHTTLYKDLEDGVVLSGGEMQKIAIGRALYKSSPYLILDEPTASLDPYSEQDIFERFDQMTQTRGALFISHNLSSCHFSDYIYVLEGGRKIEEGTHQTLLEKKQRYYQLWHLQIEKYKS